MGFTIFYFMYFSLYVRWCGTLNIFNMYNFTVLMDFFLNIYTPIASDVKNCTKKYKLEYRF